jgi:hypothetical protein
LRAQNQPGWVAGAGVEFAVSDPNAVVKVGFGLRDRLPVDDPNQRPQCQIDKNDKSRRQCRMQRMAASRQ